MNLNTALSIAVTEFANLKDKAGEPYILHLLRVMLAMDTEEEMIVAILHDLLEDIPTWNEDRLRSEGAINNVIDALIYLTRRSKSDKLDNSDSGNSINSDNSDNYFDYIYRLSTHPLARKVKIADLKDNLYRLHKLFIYRCGSGPFSASSYVTRLADRYIKALACLEIGQ